MFFNKKHKRGNVEFVRGGIFLMSNLSVELDTLGSSVCKNQQA